MGAAVSDWRLARSVSIAGQMGVVSGTAIDVILARRLQDGDPGGDLRRALAAFPIPEVSQRILDRFFIEGGKTEDAPFKSKAMLSQKMSTNMLDLLIVSNFVEVYLAKEGHNGVVGINFLEKIQSPTLPSIYGAMLANVDYILMGAGIPRAIPGIMDQLAKFETVSMKLNVQGATPDDNYKMTFDPTPYQPEGVSEINRPDFLAIISFATLANVLAKKASGKVNGFIVEGPTAGGHNAPPRGKVALTTDGQPIYTKRDIPDLNAIKKIGLPFWLAGGYSSPERISEALEFGAAGVQIGTSFAFCNESGLEAGIKQEAVNMVRHGDASVFTDPLASPTGFPFKVMQISESLSDQGTYLERSRICDLGYLRHAYKREDDTLGWRCPAEPQDQYLKKGGNTDDLTGRKCVCNGLMANIGLGQVQKVGGLEKPLVTAGDDFTMIQKLLGDNKTSYSAVDVLNYLLSEVAPEKLPPKVTVTAI